MKKLLTMALALMMVLSLFAVPTMAATMTEQLTPNGDFESFAVGTTAADAGFGAASKTTVTVADFVADGLPANGANNTKALKAVINTAGDTAEVRSGSLDMVANAVYTVSFDYIILDDELPNSNYYGAGFSAGGASSAKVYYSNDDGATWSTNPATYVNVNAETVDTDEDGKADKMATGTWVSFTTKVKSAEARSNAYFIFKTVNKIAGAAAGDVAYYIDNISITRETEAAAVTKTVTGNGTITGIADVVGFNTSHTLTLTPASTSYLSSLVIDGNDVTEDVTQTWDGTLGNYVGTFDVTVAADTTIVATYADYTLVSKVNDDMEGIDYEIGSVDHSTTAWGKSSSAATTIETDATYGQYIKITAGDVRTPKHTMDLGLYKFSFDAKADTAGSLKLQHSSVTSGNTGNGKYNGNVAGAGYVDITTSWAHYEFMFELLAYAGTHTADSELNLSFGMNTTSGLCIDNVKVEYYSTAAPQPPVVEPEVFDVVGTTNNEAYGTVAASAATSAGEAVTFTVTPKLGYYVAAATLNGENVLASFDAYEGGTYTVEEVAEDVELAVEFAAVAAKGENVATLTDSFVAADTAVTFGKVLDTTDATSWGIELKKDGVGVTPYHGGSYLYKANATNANGQYAIEFIGLEAGTYQIRSYVYVNGVAEFGAPSTFVVD